MTHRSFRLTLLARADQTGLGYQTLSYYKHLQPDRTIVIDISNLNSNIQHYDWYQNAELIRGIPSDQQVMNILRDTDVLLTAETPYNLNLYTIARRMGVKTVCVENPEFYDHIKYPQFDMPDLIILPSTWQQQEITQHSTSRGTKVVQLHHPVDRSDITFRLRTTRKFLHIAGKPAANDRNGTFDFLEACQDGIITTQDDKLAERIKRRYRNTRVLSNVQDQNWLYQLGDVLVLPRKYGGNCLPLNEALASGMPVIMPDIEPNSHILPKEWLVPASKVGFFTPRTKVDIHQVDIQALRDKLNWFRTCDIEVESRKASDLADTISWETLLPKWLTALENV
jgi:hypothetical protein